MYKDKATGRRAKPPKRRLSRRGKKYLYGVALAGLPILTAYGIITEEIAALYATLLGAILVPWLGLVDTAHNEQENLEQYWRGLDEGYHAASGNDEGEEWRN